MSTFIRFIALITGITGQDGSYLAEFLLEKKYAVWGIIRRSSNINTTRIDHIYDKLTLRYGDLTDSSNLLNILIEIKNTYQNIERLEIYNLAAMSHLTAPPTKVGGFYLIQLFDSYFWFHFFDLSFFRLLFLLILFA